MTAITHSPIPPASPPRRTAHHPPADHQASARRRERVHRGVVASYLHNISPSRQERSPMSSHVTPFADTRRLGTYPRLQRAWSLIDRAGSPVLQSCRDAHAPQAADAFSAPRAKPWLFTVASASRRPGRANDCIGDGQH